VAIGNFDGVHRGHARIVARLLALAKNLPGPAGVFTFVPQPAAILRPEAAPPPLTWTDRKVELLAELGVDLVVVYPTDRAFLQLSAREFFDQIVRQRFDARAMVEGPNFFFGHDRAGNIHTLREFCDEATMALEVVEPLQVGGQIVSSSRIRKLVAQGAVGEAKQMLTRPYRIRGEVVHGAGRGAKLGYPTANLHGIRTLLPAEGIYAGLAWAEGRSWPAAISLGPNPTFGEGSLKVEVHLLDYAGDLYGQVIEVDFLAHLRDILRFASVEELLIQMDRDMTATRRIAEEEVGSGKSEVGDGTP
jgi:riboflavin kinase/FMN adenylyltransferase